MLQSVQLSDNEDTIKNFVNKFLDNAYYRNQYLIKENVNHIDLIILNGKNNSNRIGVIVET